MGGDQEQLDMIVNDVAAVVGSENAQRWMMNIWGEMVKNELDAAQNTPPGNKPNLFE